MNTADTEPVLDEKPGLATQNMGRKKIIIDTDPGIDDVLAILLALSVPAEVEVMLLSVTFGNTDVDK